MPFSFCLDLLMNEYKVHVCTYSVQFYMYTYIIKSEKNWLNSYQKQLGNYVNIFLLAVIYLFRWVIFLINNRVSWEKNSVLILVVVVFRVVLLACIITRKNLCLRNTPAISRSIYSITVHYTRIAIATCTLWFFKEDK